jgi:DNA-binding protein HU-beta
MTKRELAKKVAESQGIPEKKANAVIDEVFSEIGNAMIAGDKVTIIGFGTFGTGRRNARVGKNPRTGETMDIPATTTAKFTAGAALKRALN